MLNYLKTSYLYQNINNPKLPKYIKLELSIDNSKISLTFFKMILITQLFKKTTPTPQKTIKKTIKKKL